MKWTVLCAVLCVAVWACGCGDDGTGSGTVTSNNGTTSGPGDFSLDDRVCLPEEEAGEYHPVCWPTTTCLHREIIPCESDADCADWPGTTCHPDDLAGRWCGFVCGGDSECPQTEFCVDTEAVSPQFCEVGPTFAADDPLCPLRLSVEKGRHDDCADHYTEDWMPCLKFSERPAGEPGVGPRGPHSLIPLPSDE